jgi:hypothetical protein
MRSRRNAGASPLLFAGRHRMRERGDARPPDDVIVEEEVSTMLYGDAVARRRIYATQRCRQVDAANREPRLTDTLAASR